MESKSSRRDFLLGIVFFGALALLLYYTIVLTGFSLQDKYYLEASFPNAAGLKEGDAVLVAGRSTGTVRLVAFRDDQPADRRIEVLMEFKEAITLHPGYDVRISEFTVLGGRVIEIDPGPVSAGLLPSNAQIIGTVGTSAIAAIGKLVTENREAVTEIISNLQFSSRALKNGEGPLGALLMSADLKAEIEHFMDVAGNLADNIEAGKGVLGLLAADQEARRLLLEMISNGASGLATLEDITQHIAGGNGVAGAMIYDEQLQADTTQLINDLRGSASLLRDVLEEANQGRGLFGAILTNETMSQDAADLLANLNLTSERLANGEGTIGRLLTEEFAYDELLKSLRLLTATLEDVREAQPVSSFTGLLFGTTF
jgi:phospholipid/cholesterol/gamma-HCH transport system substrate-binding protein